MMLLFCLLAFPTNLLAQEADDSSFIANDSLAIKDAEADSLQQLEQEQGGRPKPSKYIPTEEDMKQTFFQGFTVSADVLNMGLYFLSDYGNLEAALRLNLLNAYFPVAEVGLGKCNKTDYNTKIKFSTNAPYFKIGLDYNILKNKWQTNKLFVGIRYGISKYNYSFSGPDQNDPIWNTTAPLDEKSLSATSHYGEFVFGCQIKIWSIMHMGWSARYKYEFHTTKSIYSHPYYIPGYGTTTNSSYWGATYNISFDLNWGKKKPTVKEAVENAVEDYKDSRKEKEVPHTSKP